MELLMVVVLPPTNGSGIVPQHPRITSGNQMAPCLLSCITHGVPQCGHDLPLDFKVNNSTAFNLFCVATVWFQSLSLEDLGH